ncbi:MAG: MFS transporter [Pseudolabrys sp.]|nr:MFS transporter [Pseudolabrys sp.]
MESAPTAQPAVSRGTLIAMAAGCGITVGNIYFCQPLLDQMAVSFGVPEHIAGLVAVATQVGYAIGLMFILPLADAVNHKRLIRILLWMTTASLAAAAFSPTVPVLIAASLAISVTTVVPQMLIPIVSGLVPPRQRGRVIGTLQTGLILGVLLSRTVSGSIAEATDTWRTSYVLAAVLTGGLALLLPRMIPPQAARTVHISYLTLMRSLLPLLKLRPLLLSMGLGFCGFAAFSVFWATLAFHLASPTFNLGPAMAGLFGLLGAPGGLLAPYAGRLSDKYGTLAVNAFGLTAAAIAFVVSGTFGAVSLLALVVVVNVIDLGMQSGQVANQTRIFALGDGIRARLNTIYMVSVFVGGATGSFAGAYAWTFAGWRGVSALGLGLIIAAALFLVAMRKNDKAPQPIA